MQKRMYKVLAPIPRADGTGDWFMRVGNGYENKDASINVFLDAIPVGALAKGMKLQIRQLDEADLRQREENRTKAARAAIPIGPAGALAIAGPAAASDPPL